MHIAGIMHWLHKACRYDSFAAMTMPLFNQAYFQQ